MEINLLFDHSVFRKYLACVLETKPLSKSTLQHSNLYFLSDTSRILIFPHPKPRLFEVDMCHDSTSIPTEAKWPPHQVQKKHENHSA